MREDQEFLWRVSALAFVRGKLGFEPDARQAEALARPYRRLILNCTRQWGKSTVTAAKAVHTAWSRPESLVLVVSRSERQSAELVRKARRFAARLGQKVRGDGDNRCSVLFPNGSRIIGAPSTEDTIVGFSAVSLLIVDEAARVRDELYQEVRPMMATSNGDLWLLSTPNGKRGFFWNTWARGGPEWKRVAVPATECPRIAASFLEEERREKTAKEFGQSYLCEFHEDEDALFERELVELAVSGRLAPLVPAR